MPAGVKIPTREVIGRTSPQRIYEFGDKIAANLKATDEAKQATRERSGKISPGKLGQPTLWAVLDIIGVPRDFDPYLLGKFKRGNDVEARAIQFLTGIEADKVEPGVLVKSVPGAILSGDFVLQAESNYRGGVGYIDLRQMTGSQTPETAKMINHEIKSSTKMSYDRVAASGRYNGKTDPENGIGVPYYHHALQLATYCLGDGTDIGFLHYFNADDYRLTTFSINPLDYKEEIDKEIDDITLVFMNKQLPTFEAFLPYHKAYKKTTYGDWNDLTPVQMTEKLQREYPEQYKKFMEITI